MHTQLSVCGVRSITNRRRRTGMHCSDSDAGLDSKPRPRMKRQRIALWMLCVCLTGLAPSAIACSAPRQATGDCCPTGQRSPCETPARPDVVQLEFSCCAGQPALSQAAIFAPSSRKVDALRVPFDAATGAPQALFAATPRFDSSALPISVSARIDQAQIYLLTGRLRL